MDIVTGLALAWIAAFAVVGGWRGLWKGVAACLSLAAAYGGSVLLAGPLSQLLLERVSILPRNPSLAWALSASVLFVGIGIAVRLLVTLVSKGLPVTRTWLDRAGGALLGAAYGGVIGTFALWGASIAVENMPTRSGEPLVVLDSPLVDRARGAVAAVSAWNMRHSGASESTTALTAALTERPTQVMRDLQGTFQSPEFTRMARDPDIRQWAQDNDVPQLVESPPFQAFLQSAHLQALRRELEHSGYQWTDREIAELSVELWRDLDQLERHPQYQQLIDDPEVRAFLQGDRQITPALLGKAKQLMSLLGEQEQTAAGE